MKKFVFNFKNFSIFTVWAWLFLFALIPFLFILATSLLHQGTNSLVTFKPTLQYYSKLIQPLYGRIFLRSFYLAGLCSFICLLIAYPFAFFIAKTKSRFKPLLLLIVMIPFWTSSLIRSYAMMAILKAKGMLNVLLISLHIIHVPILWLYTNFAVIVGLIYNLFPFMVLPLYANIERLDERFIEAARDLGANWFTIIWKILIPLTMPGIMAGLLLVFLPAMTLFYIPDILGGAKSVLLGNIIEDQFLFTNNWPQGSAISIALTLIMAFLLWIYARKNPFSLKQDLF